MKARPHDYLAICLLLLACLITQTIQPARYFLRLKCCQPPPRSLQPETPNVTFWKVSNSPTRCNNENPRFTPRNAPPLSNVA